MLGMSTRGGRFVSAFLAVSVMYQVVMSALAQACHSVRMSGRKESDNIGCLISGFLLGCCDAVAHCSPLRRNPCSELVC